MNSKEETGVIKIVYQATCHHLSKIQKSRSLNLYVITLSYNVFRIYAQVIRNRCRVVNVNKIAYHVPRIIQLEFRCDALLNRSLPNELIFNFIQ